jgi:hypothetical protein
MLWAVVLTETTAKMKMKTDFMVSLKVDPILIMAPGLDQALHCRRIYHRKAGTVNDYR